MACDRFAFSSTDNTDSPSDQQGDPAMSPVVLCLRASGAAARHRVVPYEALLRGRAVARLAVAEARVAELESALRNAGELASHDPLTGAFNRRGMHDVFSREAALARQTGQPLALALIELDDFKRVNALHGHAVGDAALVHLARLISRTLRPTDCCSRWDGERFVVLMPGADRAAARRALRRVQAALAAQPVAAAALTLSCTAGVVRAQNSESLEQMLARAERAIQPAMAASTRRMVSV